MGESSISQNPRMLAAAPAFYFLLISIVGKSASACPADSLECPAMDTFCAGGVGSGHPVGSWQECGVLCDAEPTCFFWSFVLPSGPSAGFCILQPDCDLCLDGEVGFAISGKKGCVA